MPLALRTGRSWAHNALGLSRDAPLGKHGAAMFRRAARMCRIDASFHLNTGDTAHGESGEGEAWIGGVFSSVLAAWSRR